MPQLDHKTSNYRRDALVSLRQLAAKFRDSDPWRAQCLENLTDAIEQLTDRRVPTKLEIELPDGEAQLLGRLYDNPPRPRTLLVTPPESSSGQEAAPPRSR